MHVFKVKMTFSTSFPHYVRTYCKCSTYIYIWFYKSKANAIDKMYPIPTNNSTWEKTRDEPRSWTTNSWQDRVAMYTPKWTEDISYLQSLFSIQTKKNFYFICVSFKHSSSIKCYLGCYLALHFSLLHDVKELIFFLLKEQKLREDWLISLGRLNASIFNLSKCILTYLTHYCQQKLPKLNW